MAKESEGTAQLKEILGRTEVATAYFRVALSGDEPDLSTAEDLYRDPITGDVDSAFKQVVDATRGLPLAKLADTLERLNGEFLQETAPITPPSTSDRHNGNR